MLKKLIGKSPEYVGKIKDNLEARHFVTKEVCARVCDRAVKAFLLYVCNFGKVCTLANLTLAPVISADRLFPGRFWTCSLRLRYY